MTELRLVVPDGSGGRADRVASDLSGLTRSRVQHLITDGQLTLDGVPLKARSVVRAGDARILQVPAAEPPDIEPEALPREVNMRYGSSVPLSTRSSTRTPTSSWSTSPRGSSSTRRRATGAEPW